MLFSCPGSTVIDARRLWSAGVGSSRVQLSPTLYLVMLCRELEIGGSGSIYTLELANATKRDFCSP